VGAAGLCSRAGFDPTETLEPSLRPSPSDSTDAPTRAPTRPAWLLLLGAALGLALASYGMLEKRAADNELPDGVVARVGDHMIRRIDYERVLAGVESDLRSPIDAEMRRRVLERMIDEELLVQRAIALGLAEVDRRVRGELTSGLIDSIVSEADAEQPSDRAVAEHFEQNIDFFTRPGRLRARTIFFSAQASSAHGGALPGEGEEGGPRAPARERAREAADRLARGESPSEVESALGDPQVSPLPDVLLPASKIRDYVGPSLLERIQSLQIGAWSEPIESAGGVYLVQLVDREDSMVPSLESVEDLVREDLKRRRGDEALRRYLEELRSEIPVSVNESAFESSPD
jgi:hypothetical protein